jgi:hypothetical protein
VLPASIHKRLFLHLSILVIRRGEFNARS